MPRLPPIVIFKEGEPVKDSWIKHMHNRIKRKNANNLVTVVGGVGTGKTYSAISICEKLAKKNGVPFTIDHIVFSLKELMSLINNPKLTPKGACIIFDEPQVSISNRSFQSIANRVFNYLVTTFRHRNLSLFFCTPFEDLLDLSTRKLFQIKMVTKSINRTRRTCTLRTTEMEYNSQRSKFYEKFMWIYKKSEGKSKYVKYKQRAFEIEHPSGELVRLYEIKKKKFTDKLNNKIVDQLIAFNLKENKETMKPLKGNGKPLTAQQEVILKCWKEGKLKLKEIAEVLGRSLLYVCEIEKSMRNKGYAKENYKN